MFPTRVSFLCILLAIYLFVIWTLVEVISPLRSVMVMILMTGSNDLSGIRNERVLLAVLLQAEVVACISEIVLVVFIFAFEDDFVHHFFDQVLQHFSYHVSMWSLQDKICHKFFWRNTVRNRFFNIEIRFLFLSLRCLGWTLLLWIATLWWLLSRTLAVLINLVPVKSPELFNYDGLLLSLSLTFLLRIRIVVH